ncbi:MAG: LLM class flavin-dependent oxidoreductase [Gammaproteobacteria bacterium]|nr:LLM class flavin-dependent oxidoreductase [Gammaproteobacteria bacterium]
MARMRFGIFLPPLHLPTHYNPTYALQRDVEIVKLVDDIGFDEAWFGEHHSGGVEIICDPMLFIAHVATQTRSIRLGTGVVSLPYHNPLWTADRLALLDHLTRGRVMLGIGPGALATDAAMIGMQPHEQRDALEFDADVLMHLLTSDEPLTVETSRYKLVDARLQLDFYQDPHPEIAAAAVVSPSGPRLAGKHGIGLISIGATMKAGVDVLAMHWDVVEQRAREFGKRADRNRWRVVGLMHLADTKARALADVRHGIREFCDYLQHTAAAPQLQVTGNTIDEYIEWALNNGSTVIGTYAEAIEHIETVLSLSNGGFGSYLLFDHNWADFAAKKRHYEIFGDYVVPHFKHTNRRMQRSEAALRAVRDPLAQAQQDAINAFRARHNKKGESD